MTDCFGRSAGESSGEHAPRRGLTSALLGTRAVESSPPAPGRHRPASAITVPSRLDAHKTASGGTTSTNVRFAQFWVEAQKRAILQASPARRRLGLGSIPPREALAAARALLHHPPV